MLGGARHELGVVASKMKRVDIVEPRGLVHAGEQRGSCVGSLRPAHVWHLLAALHSGRVKAHGVHGDPVEACDPPFFTSPSEKLRPEAYPEDRNFGSKDSFIQHVHQMNALQTLHSKAEVADSGKYEPRSRAKDLRISRHNAVDAGTA